VVTRKGKKKVAEDEEAIVAPPLPSPAASKAAPNAAPKAAAAAEAEDGDDLGEDEDDDDDEDGDEEEEAEGDAPRVAAALGLKAKPSSPPISKAPLREPARRHGSPMLAAIPITPRWSTKAGGELTIEIVVRNAGGAGKGVWVELGGPGASAVELGEVTLERASRARLDGGRAMIPDAVIPAGYEPVKKGEAPPPDEGAMLRVVLRAQRTGSALLTIRVGPGAGGSTSGSALVGRTLEIV
jgi:hypothetical protein